jgi:hypothetical protein
LLTAAVTIDRRYQILSNHRIKGKIRKQHTCSLVFAVVGKASVKFLLEEAVAGLIGPAVAGLAGPALVELLRGGT